MQEPSGRIGAHLHLLTRVFSSHLCILSLLHSNFGNKEWGRGRVWTISHLEARGLGRFLVSQSG